jgi:peptide/nickel transport system substrate-binding protein
MKQAAILMIVIFVASPLLSCGSPEGVVVEREVTKVVTEKVVETVIVQTSPQVTESEVTKVVEVEKIVVATPEPEPEPAVGGSLVYALAAGPDSLDVHKSSSLGMETIMAYVGATLVAKAPLTGETVPYLAKSWTISEDGLKYEFILREDVRFHDGTPLTAHDFVWTFQRAMDPATKSAAAGTVFRGVIDFEAVDDYTLRLNLAWPNYPLMDNLALPYGQPMSPDYVEEMGEDYGRHPLGVGPFVFKEWQTGDRIILERNPEFNWGPSYTHGGAPFVETIEFRIIPEYATTVVGLEAGEIDYASVQSKDVATIADTGRFQILEALWQGCSPYVALNVSKPPFDDILVRQAFNLAVNREVLIKTVLSGYGIPQYGPVSESVPGYWPGVEYVGYGYDLDRAKALMEEAGYAYNDQGLLEKDGQPLSLVLKTSPSFGKVAEILQEQFKALGVQIQLEQKESSILFSELGSGAYTLGLGGWIHPDTSILYVWFHSSMLGAMNTGNVNDPELDQLLEDMVFTADPEAFQEAAIGSQRYIVEQAYIVPLYTRILHSALNHEFKDAAFSSMTGRLELYDAYIDSE